MLTNLWAPEGVESAATVCEMASGWTRSFRLCRPAQRLGCFGVRSGD